MNGARTGGRVARATAALRRKAAGAPLSVVLGAALGLTLALTGCMVGPDYVRPTAPVPATYKELPAFREAHPQDDAPRGNWWAAFGEPELDALIAELDAANPTIAVAAAQMRAAQAATRAARAALYPAVGVNAGASRGDRAGSVGGSANAITNSYAVDFGANWEIDLWGGIQRSVEAKAATADASAASFAGARLSMRAQLATDYLLLRVQDAQIELLKSTVAAYERSRTLVRNQYRAGIVGRGDVVQSEAQLKATEAQLVDARIARAQLEHAVAVLVGKPPAAFSVAARPLAAAFPTPPVALPSELLERRPDVAAAERQVAAANAQIGVAQAAFFPTLMLSADGGFQNSAIGSLLALPARYWALGAALAQPLFDAGLRSAQKDQAIAAYDATVAGYRGTVLNAFQEVEDALAALSLLQREAVLQDEAVKAAREAATIAANQYKAGTTSYLAVVVLQAAALSDERAALAVLGRRYAASVALIRALGGGWSTEQMPDDRTGRWNGGVAHLP